MNKIVSLALILTLYACSKEVAPTPQSAPAKAAVSGAVAKSILENTSRFNQAEILGAAAAMAQSGKSLDSLAAERCWLAEAKRPDIANVCLLLWSTGRERSGSMEQILATESGKNRLAAVAAVRHEFPLALLGWGEFQALLIQLGKDSVWLRSRAALIWIRSHPVPGIKANEDIIKLLEGAEGPLLPADFQDFHRALQALNPARAEALTFSHCQPAVDGELRVRCWRYLSALVDPATGQGLPARLNQWLPAESRFWPLFRITSPLRARLLEQYLTR